MGVIYKLKDEVVQFIISQRQSNPLYSCRQLAESASQQFGLNLSKSSVHDVLKESGIITPRGRKPKNKFAIPQEKKKQIQVSLAQVKLISPPVEAKQIEETPNFTILPREPGLSLIPDVAVTQNISQESPQEKALIVPEEDNETSVEYTGAGKIFLKAALWDLGVFTEAEIKGLDREYYLTYSKGIQVVLENNKEFFIELRLPIERCIRETADGLINNVRPMIVDKVSDEALFEACMKAEMEFKIKKISIVEQNNHNLFEIDNFVDTKRCFEIRNRLFVDSKETDSMKRLKELFFTQSIDNNEVIDNILSLNGFDIQNKHEFIVTLIIPANYENKMILQEAVNKLNSLCLFDEKGRSVRVKIKNEQSS